jgi:hypothetical protein
MNAPVFNYEVFGWRRGQTSGQRPVGIVMVRGASSKAEANRIGLQLLQCHKVTSWRMPKSMTCETTLQDLSKLFVGLDVRLVDAAALQSQAPPSPVEQKEG